MSCLLDTTAPTATVAYATTGSTTGSVTATLTGLSEAITGLNVSSHTFSTNGSFTFTFSDLAGNSGSATATVSWIISETTTSSN